GDTSGPGSYGALAQFKAKIINSFVLENDITSVIEFGCGDGNQLSLFEFQKYIGLDVTESSIKLCKDRFSSDKSKSFFVYNPFCFIDNHSLFKAELALSLDVIFHLIEEDVYEKYMSALFESADKYVIIYSSNKNEITEFAHVKHRLFSNLIDDNFVEWTLLKHIPNKHIFNGNAQTGSFAEFYIYEKHL
ncbi:class I SAM-dependent methyltransferase, partial [Fibrobacterota bacterium]